MEHECRRYRDSDEFDWVNMLVGAQEQAQEGNYDKADDLEGQQPLMRSTTCPVNLKLVCMDYYIQRGSVQGMDACWSRLEGNVINTCPVVRLFGCTPGGQKMCLHLHHAFPYFYVEYENDLPNDSLDSAKMYAHRLGHALNKSLNLKYALMREQQDQTSSDVAQPQQSNYRPHSRVYDVVVVKGRHFYGFRDSESLWMKIMMYNPSDVKQAAQLLQSGVVLGRKFQPYESHIPYLLQVKIDYNLHGMGWVRLDTVMFRRGLPDIVHVQSMMVQGGWIKRREIASPDGILDSKKLQEKERAYNTSIHGNDQKFSEATVPVQCTWNPGHILYNRMSTCELEADASIFSVRNIDEKRFVDITNAPLDLQLVDSLGPIWRDEERRQGKDSVKPTPPRINRDVLELGHVVREFREMFREANMRRLDYRQSKEAVPSPDHLVSSVELPSANQIKSLPLTEVQSDFGLSNDDRNHFVDTDILQTQVAGPGVEDIDRMMDELATIKREFGAMESEKDEDQDDMLLQLVKHLGEQGSQSQDPTQFFSQHDIMPSERPSQHEVELRMQRIFERNMTEAEKDCLDIMEASQMMNRYLEESGHKFGRESKIPQVDGEYDSDSGESNIQKNTPSMKLASEKPYLSAEKLRKSGIQLAELRALFHGKSESSSDESSSDQDSNQSTPKPDLSFVERKPKFQRNHHDALRKKTFSKPSRKCQEWREESSQIPYDDYEWTMDSDDIVNQDKQDEDQIEDPHQISQLDSLVPKVKPKVSPPTVASVQNSWYNMGLLPIVHPSAHFSDEEDVGKKVQVFAGKAFKMRCTAVNSLDEFPGRAPLYQNLLSTLPKDGEGGKSTIILRPATDPPSLTEMRTTYAGNISQSKKNSKRKIGSYMDPNTGKLLPNAFEDGPNESQTSLLGSPSLPSIFMDGKRYTCTPDADIDAIHTLEHTGSRSNQHEQIRPTSPKYDEAGMLYDSILHHVDGPFVARGKAEETPVKSSDTFSRYLKQRKLSGSQITPPRAHEYTPESQLGFKTISPGKGEGLTVACIEVHASCRGELLPDPRFDAVVAISVSIYDDNEIVQNGQYYTRILLWEQTSAATCVPFNNDGIHDVQYTKCNSEKSLFEAFISAIRHLDPDVLLGFEIQRESLGYLAERATCALENNFLLNQISRIPSTKGDFQDMKEHDQYGWDHSSGIHVPGRIVLNLWRILKSEAKLGSYSFQNCVASILRVRVPYISKPQLHRWFMAGSTSRWKCISHIILLTRLSLSMLEQLDLIGRTSELARTFGIDFFSVLSRGSQYRVESMMVRLAHSQNYIVLSPSNEQVARQPAMEALPLVMEPQSGMYEDPVCVLDFQSLYPSMIIAYNLCFSTCMGKPSHLEGSEDDGKLQRLGCLENFTVQKSLESLGIKVEDLIIAPNGVSFVPKHVRGGILPRLLQEILDTRIMVKSAMKSCSPAERVLLKCLNARQFGLKLIANVTYGYTAAGFSGRMPMAELADAIVQSGRATLERAISLIQNHPSWNADVVYGDTDSLFVRLKGRSVEEAHQIGLEIARVITAQNPAPVLLKLEKVYRPCFLLSKKRYVGAMYESPDQRTYIFDAKGIETVRRDSCPAVAKILEQTLRILFRTADLSIVRKYLERQWSRILSGKISIMDFVFAKEVRLGTYSNSASSIPPAALVATKAMASDPRAEPRFGERVPYVVVHGEPNARLIDMVVPPEVLVESGGSLRLHSMYYITKQIIPALERVLSLVGADVRSWYAQMPKSYRHMPHKRPLMSLPLGRSSAHSEKAPLGSTIDRFYLSRHCVCCDSLTRVNQPLCPICLADPQLVAAILPARLNRTERQYVHMVRICTTCGGSGGSKEIDGNIICRSLDCGVYYERRKKWFELQTARLVVEAANILL